MRLAPPPFARARMAVFALALAALPHAAVHATTWLVHDDAGLLAANAGVVAGDLVLVSPGTYTVPVQPHANGTALQRITYCGSMAAPDSAVVAGIRLDRAGQGGSGDWGDYVTVKWIATSAGAGSRPYSSRKLGGNLYVARFDSLIGVHGTGSLDAVAKHCVYDSLQLSGLDCHINMRDDLGNADGGDTRDYDCRVTGNLIQNSRFDYTKTLNADMQFIVLMRAQYNTFAGNTFNFTQNDSGFAFASETYFSYFNSFQGNTWNLDFNSNANTVAYWGWRDSSAWNRYIGNVVNAHGTAGVNFGLSQDGHIQHSVHHHYLGHNVFNLANPKTYGLGYTEDANTDTIEFNVVRCDGAIAFQFGKITRNCVVRHNTFLSTYPTVAKFNSYVAASGTKIVGNIFYSTAPNAAGSLATIEMPETGVFVDSGGVVYSAGGTPGHAIRLGTVSGAPASGPGYGLPDKFVWASPRFADSTFATFDPTLLPESGARSADLEGGYAGAVEPDGVPTSFTLTTAATGSGSVAPAGPTTVAAGANVTVTATPQPGHEIASLLVDGADQGDLTRFTFTGVRANHRVEAVYVPAAASTAVPRTKITALALAPIAPNPSPGTVAIDFSLASRGHARLRVLDVGGRQCAVLADGEYAAGHVRATWRAPAPGIYFARLEAAGRTLVRRFEIVR